MIVPDEGGGGQTQGSDITPDQITRSRGRGGQAKESP